MSGMPQLIFRMLLCASWKHDVEQAIGWCEHCCSVHTYQLSGCSSYVSHCCDKTLDRSSCWAGRSGPQELEERSHCRERWVLVLRFVLIWFRIPVRGMVPALIYGGLFHLCPANLWTLARTQARTGITRHLVELFNSSHGNTTTYLLVMIQGQRK